MSPFMPGGGSLGSVMIAQKSIAYPSNTAPMINGTEAMFMKLNAVMATIVMIGRITMKEIFFFGLFEGVISAPSVKVRFEYYKILVPNRQVCARIATEILIVCPVANL